MSTMNLESVVQQHARIVSYFLATRAPEVLVLQASPILGCWLAGAQLNRSTILPLGLLLLGSFALTAHIFLFNDLVESENDARDARRAEMVFPRQGIGRVEVIRILITLFVIAFAAFTALGSLTLLFGSAIALLGLLYSSSSTFGKRAPVMGSVNHFLGGALHFLLGYTAFHAMDKNGLLISLFFGLVFAGGHLNQEVRDFHTDRLNGIRTNAVVFGRRETFYASIFTFSAAYLIASGLAAYGVLPKLLLGSLALWAVHIIWSLQALRRGFGLETTLWIQRRYRFLFAIIGVMILIARWL